MTDAISELEEALTKAVDRMTTGGNVGILISGIDSSIIAKTCEELGRNAALYSACMEGSRDAAQIKELEKNFKSKVSVRKICESELENYAKKVMLAIHARDPLSVGIGIPLYMACEAAKNDSIEAILMGQGADELFAGYHRYMSVPAENLESELRRDFETYCGEGVKRDRAIANANSLELRLPYLDERVAAAAFDIPAAVKIKDGVRKYPLREIARRKGLSSGIVNREKKAVQYSTGVDKALRKLAKNDLKEYLSEVYRSMHHGR